MTRLVFLLTCALLSHLHCLCHGCRDWYWKLCEYWASNGDCTNEHRDWMSGNCCQSCQQTSPACSADKNQNCAYWAQEGYCTTNKDYMDATCCVSCRTCESVWDVSAGGSTCGARIEYLVNNQGLGREQAKARVGAEFPAECGACKGVDTGCQGDKSENCQYWASQGYCTRSAEYMKENCCQSCEGNSGGGDHCKPLSASQPKDRALNVVLVPSAFNGDMVLWAQKAKYITDVFKQYKPFDAEQIPQLNIWYVDVDMPNDDGQQCHFGCHGIARLLCCNGKHNFIAHAKQHCGSGIIMNTLIIHNSDTYGGAGFTSDGAASCSTNSLSPQIAIHELGHSLFGLADEYSYSTQATADKHPNCDYAGCSKWADLQGRYGVGCVPGKCAGGRYYAAENSVMDTFSYKFGESNERITCCKYLYHFAAVPGYCDKFSQGGLNLQQFCTTGLWRGEYTTLSSLSVAATASSVDEQLSNTSMVVLANAVPQAYLEHAAKDPQGQGFVYVASPREWILARSSPGSDDWECLLASPTVGNAGLYPKESATGHVIENATRGNVSVYVRSASGALIRQLTFLTEEQVEIPMPTNASNVSEMNDTNVGELLVQRYSITVILNADETCHTSEFVPTSASSTASATGSPTTDGSGVGGGIGTQPLQETTTPMNNPLVGAVSTAIRIFSPSGRALIGCGLFLSLIAFH